MDLTEVVTALRGPMFVSPVGGPNVFSEAARHIEELAASNAELRDRVWALDRATHTNDPLEGEDG